MMRVAISTTLIAFSFSVAAQSPVPAPKPASGVQEKTYRAADPSEDGSKKKPGSGGGKDTTSVNFEETLLEGKMKAPAGTFLQGRKEQDKSQMVQLRAHFRRELKRSKGAIRALAH